MADILPFQKTKDRRPFLQNIPQGALFLCIYKATQTVTDYLLILKMEDVCLFYDGIADEEFWEFPSVFEQDHTFIKVLGVAVEDGNSNRTD